MATGVMRPGRRTPSVDGFVLTGQPARSRLAPQRAIADALKKRWMEGAVPLALAAVLYFCILGMTPVGFSDNEAMLNETAQMGLLAIGLTFVMVGGGIDLSIGVDRGRHRDRLAGGPSGVGAADGPRGTRLSRRRGRPRLGSTGS